MNYREMHAQYIHSEMPHVILDAQSRTTYLVMSLGPVLFAKYIWILYTCIDIVYLCSFKLHVLSMNLPGVRLRRRDIPLIWCRNGSLLGQQVLQAQSCILLRALQRQDPVMFEIEIV